MIVDTIKKGPITYTKKDNQPIFEVLKKASDPSRYKYVSQVMTLPMRMWQDICYFNHWIEESYVIRWAEMTKVLNSDASIGKHIDILLNILPDERDTSEVREVLFGGLESIDCIWTGRRLSKANTDIDHLIPFSYIRNNDLWNLLPSEGRINRNKSDKIPTKDLIYRQKSLIFKYWDFYCERFSEKFELQLTRALETKTSAPKWKDDALMGLIEVSERLAHQFGAERWEG